MTDTTLSHFRDLAASLSDRQRIPIDIVLKDDRSLSATYDPLFRTVTVGAGTFPESELNKWIRAFYRADVLSIQSKDSQGASHG
jgi:hypothetical protein